MREHHEDQSLWTGEVLKQGERQEQAVCCIAEQGQLVVDLSNTHFHFRARLSSFYMPARLARWPDSYRRWTACERR